MRGLFFEPDLLPALMLVAGALLCLGLDSWNRRSRWWSSFTATDGAVIVLTVLYFLSFFPAADRHAAVVGALRMAAYAGVYVIAARYVTRPHGLSRLAWTFFLSGVTLALVGWAAAADWINFPGAFSGTRLMSALQYPNALAGALIAALAAGAGLWSASAGIGRFVLSAGTIISMVTLLATYSRAGWLIYAGVLALMILLAPAGRRWALFIFHAAAITLAIVLGSQLLPALRSGVGTRHMLLLGAGAVAFAVLDLFSLQMSRWLEDRVTNPLTYQVLRGGLVAYVAVLSIWAAVYMIQAGPAAAGSLVPTGVSARFATITGVERSYQSRLDMAKDAWSLALERPLLGAGAGGWNALYHQVQDIPYWSSEVHNHFMQTAVETGLTGLAAFTAIWILLGIRAAGTLQRFDDEDNKAPIFWGVTIGLLGLVLRALADFDWSLPALAFWAWAMAGIIRGFDPATATGRLRRQESAEPSPSWLKPLTGPIALLVAAAVIAYPAWRLNAAGLAGAAGTRAFAEQDWTQAQEMYRRANQLDPWQGSYLMDLAQVNLILSTLGQAQAEQVEAALASALTVQPYRADLRDRAIRIYLLMGQEGLAIEQAEALVWILPKEINAYSALTELLANRAERAFRERRPEDAYDDLIKLFRLRDNLLQVQQQVEMLRNPHRRPSDRPNLPADIEFALGRAEYLRGRAQPALDHLSRIRARDFARMEELRAWIAAAAYLADRGAPADNYFVDMSEGSLNLFQQLLKIHGF